MCKRKQIEPPQARRLVAGTPTTQPSWGLKSTTVTRASYELGVYFKGSFGGWIEPDADSKLSVNEVQSSGA